MTNFKEVNMNEFFQRVKDILLNPNQTWENISAEPATETQLTRDYLSVIAIAPTLFGFLGLLFSRVNFFSALLWAVLFYLCAIGGAYLFSRALSFLAAGFNGTRDSATFFKLGVYSLTPIFLSNVFFLIPPIYGLSIVGLYGFYLFGVGFTKIIDYPPEEKLNFLIVGVICFLLSVILIYLLPALISRTAVYYSVV